jgi:hypothetical protein
MGHLRQFVLQRAALPLQIPEAFEDRKSFLE